MLPQMWSLKKGLWRGNQFKNIYMDISFWIIQMVSKSNHGCPYKNQERHKHREDDHTKTKAEMGVMQPQAQGYLESPGARRDRKCPPPKLQMVQPCWHLDFNFWSPELWENTFGKLYNRVCGVFFAAPGCWPEPFSIQDLWEPGWAEALAVFFSRSLLWWWGWTVGRTGVPTRMSAPDTLSSWVSAEAELGPGTGHPHQGCPRVLRKAAASPALTEQPGLREPWLGNRCVQGTGLHLGSEHSKGLHVCRQLVPTSHLCLWLSWTLTPWPRLMLVSRSSLNKYLSNRSLLICYVTSSRKKLCALLAP